MKILGNHIPEVYELFKNYSFMARRLTEQQLTCVTADQTIEPLIHRVYKEEPYDLHSGMVVLHDGL